MIIPAFLNSTNVETLTFTNADKTPVDWSAAGIVRATVTAHNTSIECALLSGGKLQFVPGDLQIPTMHHQAVIRVYKTGDSRGEVVAGPNLPTAITIKMEP